jgi:hypothetical protein
LALDRDDAHADELLFKRLQLIVRTNNVFVKLMSGRSGNATEHDKQRLTRGLGLGVPFVEVVVDPVLADVCVSEVSLQILLGLKSCA